MNKDFNNFLETLTPDEVTAIIKKANNFAEPFRQLEPDIFDNQANARSYTFTLELLHRYHEWLNSPE